MAKQWDDVKSIIINYYSNRTLKEVMQIMHEQHDFKASQRSYRQKFKDWGIRKYRSHDPDWSSPSSNSSGYPPVQSNEHPVQHQSWVPRQQHHQQQQQQDKWTQSSSQHPLVALRTPEPEWGGNGVVLGRETGHARNGSNVTHVSATSGQYSMGSWSRVDGQYPVVSMSSPMSLPAPASPLSQPYSPLPAHPETYPLFSHHYNPPQHPPVTQTSSQHVVPSMGTPLRQLNRGVVPEQPRHEWTQQRPSQSDLHGRRETAPEHMYPEDKLDHDVSDWARYRFTSRKDGP